MTSLDEHLTCPHCDDLYLHATRVDVYDRTEDSPTGLHIFASLGGRQTSYSDCNMSGNKSLRRDSVIIEFCCEGCGNLSKLSLAQHKGLTLFEFE
jgi:hypothetical protein